MNEKIILGMAEPYVKDGAITYEQFDKIYNMLSRREQYDVSEILFKNGINLIPEEEITNIDEIILDIETEFEQDNEANELNDKDFSVLYDPGLFTDSNHDVDTETVFTNYDVKQSNEVLCALIQQGNKQAAQDLCVKNKLLVDKYAAAYSKKYNHHLDFEDLEQAGFMGLIKAAQKYDVKLEYAFSTYAVWWIKQSISREIIDTGFVVRIPVHMMERINKVSSIEKKYPEQSIKERIIIIADEMGLSENAVRECMRLRENVLTYASLNAPIGEEDEAELEEFVPDGVSVSVEDMVANKELRRYLEEVIESLNQREQKVIRMRYGLDGEQPQTLESVGQKMGVTRERIRQIEKKAIKKLRAPSKRKKLEEYL